MGSSYHQNLLERALYRPKTRPSNCESARPPDYSWNSISLNPCLLDIFQTLQQLHRFNVGPSDPLAALSSYPGYHLPSSIPVGATTSSSLIMVVIASPGSCGQQAIILPRMHARTLSRADSLKDYNDWCLPALDPSFSFHSFTATNASWILEMLAL